VLLAPPKMDHAVLHLATTEWEVTQLDGSFAQGGRLDY
jgi:hypothetical protein